MGRTYVSTLFTTGEAFEAWIKGVQEREGAWDKKACLIDVVGDKLRLLDKDNTVLAEVDYCKTDGETITVDNSTGVITAVGLREKNTGKIFSVWLGTQKEYENLVEKEANTWYCITNDETLDKIAAKITALEERATSLEGRATVLEDRATDLEDRATSLEDRATTVEEKVSNIETGTTVVPKATNATLSDNALSLNGIAIKADENGVLYYSSLEEVEISLGASLSPTTQNLFIIQSSSRRLLRDDIIYYNGEAGTVLISEGVVAIKVPNGGEWASQSGNTVLAMRENKILIPQKRLLWNVGQAIASENPLTISENWIGKTIEMVVYFKDDKEFAIAEHIKFKIEAACSGGKIYDYVIMDKNGRVDITIDIVATSSTTKFYSYNYYYPSSLSSSYSFIPPYVAEIYEVIE